MKLASNHVNKNKEMIIIDKFFKKSKIIKSYYD
jgi:hypothetical protein